MRLRIADCGLQISNFRLNHRLLITDHRLQIYKRDEGRQMGLEDQGTRGRGDGETKRRSDVAILAT
jgi:hypothetical protein